MTLGDGIRRNIAKVSDVERTRFRKAIAALNAKPYVFEGTRDDFPAGGVSYWFKQDEIHQATHVHGGPAFLPWHRELCNRFEAMLREVDSALSLHYWDWNTDPAALFTMDFMGNGSGDVEFGAVGDPWLAGGFYAPNVTDQKFRDDARHPLLSPAAYETYSNPADPPKSLVRAKGPGVPPVGCTTLGLFWPTDLDLINAMDFAVFNELLQGAEWTPPTENGAHALAHVYIGGNLRNPHIAFRDPFVFLLHSNIDRLWAIWQRQPAHTERLDPEQVYKPYDTDPAILAALQPWAGEADWKTTHKWPVRPWFDKPQVKLCQDPSVVNPPPYAVPFTPVYREGDPGSGIGGFDLAEDRDQAFAFDYTSSGKADHLVLYRPGSGNIWILQNGGGVFAPVPASPSPGSGIGGYDLADGRDRAFAFDYNGSGKADHLVLYRPGSGTIWILQNGGGSFSPVFTSGGGIGGFDLAEGRDQAFAFDYSRSGKADHLVLYRPGTGNFWIVQHSSGSFGPVPESPTPGSGVGGYDLADERDCAFAFDYDGSGRADHLVLSRPGTGTIWMLKKAGTGFAPVYAQGDPGSGIGGFDLADARDRMCAMDFDGNGNADHLVLYRPGTGTIWILDSATP